MHLHWHRRDLRLSDNPALAATPRETVGLFVLDDDVLQYASPVRVRFLLDALEAVRARYRERGGELLLGRGDSRAVVPALAARLDASCVSWGHDYSGLARERDRAVRHRLETDGVECLPVHDAVLHEPGAITTAEGTPYKVFTYFSKKWHDREKRPPVDTPDLGAIGAVDRLEPRAPSEDGVLLATPPTISELGFEEPDASVPEAGTSAARERLQTFCADDIYRYAECRDYPAEGCVSRLSPHLKFGTIGIREVYAATDDALEAADSDAARDSVTAFRDQLAWREFYAQVLWDRPDVVTTNYKTYENPIDWREDPEAFRAWTDGETGYPIVDAGMRQLRDEAYVHNRVRMIVASFLTKDLLLDWRLGYRWFRERLVDHDTANDTGGWQWAASTGTDAQPYFRIFNPMTQGERYDPDAEYIKRYVPELADVPAETIHAWDELDDGARKTHAPAYPSPIVDHARRREDALERFERARGE